MLSTSSIVSLFLTWPFTATVPSTSSAHAIAPKSPLMPRSYNDSDLDVSLPSDTKKFYSNRLCTAEQRQLEQMDWADALRLATALASWRVNGPYQAAMDLYMGNDTRGRLGKIVEGNHNENGLTMASGRMLIISTPQPISLGQPKCILKTPGQKSRIYL